MAARYFLRIPTKGFLSAFIKLARFVSRLTRFLSPARHLRKKDAGASESGVTVRS